MAISTGFGPPYAPENVTSLPTIVPVTQQNGYPIVSLDTLSAQFDLGVANLNARVQAALANVQANPSDPKALADYQSVLGEYTTYRGVQSSSVKAFKDIDMQIIQNM